MKNMGWERPGRTSFNLYVIIGPDSDRMNPRITKFGFFLYVLSFIKQVDMFSSSRELNTKEILYKPSMYLSVNVAKNEMIIHLEDSWRYKYICI